MDEKQKIEALREALIEGEESDDAGPLNIEKIKSEARARAGLDPVSLPKTRSM